MIKVSLGELILIGMALGVLLVCWLWAVHVLRERKRERRTRTNLVLCRICGAVYPHATGGDLSVCPACGTPNERNTLDAI